MADNVASLSIEITAKTDDARQKLKDLEKLGDSFGKKITSAFEDAIFEGKGFGDTLRALALDLSKLAFRSALAPVSEGIGGLLSQAAGGFSAFAKGGVVGQPMVTPFASGGVVASPITFPLGNGRMGLAGEAGPEAILPLARGSDGRLGVRSGGGGAVSVTVNITTPNADSFRRSEGQISAMLARAVSRGQRNL
ncbi:MAG: phage tail tape measure protein [Hyphomicrobiales bacterium]|nr:phage tail tape measure protein [Hyphomicrobiales bacterium]